MADDALRRLTDREREWLWWVLPEDRPGYAALRARIDGMLVVATGRRGEGNLILGPAGHAADRESPLPSVIAFGELMTSGGRGSITVREEFNGQVEVELVEPPSGPEAGRWTYSRWSPSDPCPQCGGSVRVVGMSTVAGSTVTLAVCPRDRRLWVHAASTGICRPLPLTLFYSELMRRTGVRDPKLALRSERLFEALSSFSDDELAVAFISYNHLRTKVSEDDPLRLPPPAHSFFRRWFSFSRT